MRVDSEPAETALAGARRSSGGWYRAACPYCLELTGKPDRRQSLGLKPAIAFFACFKCGTRGRLRDVPDAVLVAERVAPDRAPTPLKGPPPGYEPLWEDETWTSVFFDRATGYLRSRGVTQAVTRAARIGIASSGRLVGRVVVPVLDVDGATWLGYSARDWTNRQDPRYRYPRGMKRGSLLYNWAALYVPTDEPLLLVEGVFDALPYWPDGVAALGKPGDFHRRLLAEAARPVAVCLDGDAWEEGWVVAEYLRLQGCRSGSVRLPPGADPNSVEHDWLREEARRCIA